MHPRRAPLWIVSIALLAVSCAAPDATPSAPPSRVAPTPLPPGRRPPPSAPYSADTTLLANRVEDAVERFDRDRWERFVDAMDPGELATDLRLTEQAVDQGFWTKEALFRNGDELFEHDFTAGEGFGPGHLRIQLGSAGGPDALSCSECHHRGGFDGAGDRTQNAFFDGDGHDPASAFERNPPATLGLGIEQRLAEEMTADLARQKDAALAQARFKGGRFRMPVSTKGVSFGMLTANPDGTIDGHELAGIDLDLVVKPFGWKGGVATLREFVIDGFQRHHGIQFPRTNGPGTGPEWDRDRDGAPNELTDGMLLSVVAYLSMLDVPVMIPPRDPDLLARHIHGSEVFASAHCDTCHVPSLPLYDSKLPLSKTLSLDVLLDGEAPRPRKDVFDSNGIQILLFSDLKRHKMGPDLAERAATASGIRADEFLTRPLWGLAETAPYLHDGRATTLDAAILAHGGEAAESRNQFATMSRGEKADLRIFLLSLTRYPRIEYR